MKTHIEINPRFENLRPLVESIAAEGVPAGAELIFNGSRNRVYSLSHQSIKLNIKAFQVPRFPNSFVYGTLRQSKAKRSYLHALRLIDLGFLTPEPVAYIEEMSGIRFLRSYYISIQVEAKSLYDWETLPYSDVLLHALGAEMVKLHRAGVYHLDFSPGNILYIKDESGEYRFFYVDLNRMRFDVHSLSQLMNNFRCIHLDLEQTLRLAREYAAAAGADPAEVEAEATRRVMQYREEKSRHNFFKRLFANGKK